MHFFQRFTLCAGLASASLLSAQELTLPQAREQLLASHPELTLFTWQLTALQAGAERADQRAPFSVAVDVAEMAGSGDYSGLKSAETSLSLSSYFELGRKRDARGQTARARLSVAQAEQQTRSLALLGTLQIAFVQALAQQEQCALAREQQVLAQHTLKLVTERVQKAAAPEAERMRAQVASQQAALNEKRCLLMREQSYQQLAQAMGQPEVDFSTLRGALFELDELDWSTLQQAYAHSPWPVLSEQQRALSRSETTAVQAENALDIQWSLGVTHFAATDEAALAAGLSVPLFNERRNRPQVRQAQAQDAQLQVQLQQSERLRQQTLQQAFQQHQQAQAELKTLQNDILPLLESAYAQAKISYQQGRYGYSEWVSAGHEMLAAKAQKIETAERAWRAQSSLESLVGAIKK